MIEVRWTPKQVERAMRYGVCRCGAPKLTERVERVENGRLLVLLRIVCENGHEQP